MFAVARSDLRPRRACGERFGRGRSPDDAWSGCGVAGGQAGELSATFKAETEGPAGHRDVAAFGRGLGLGFAIILGLLPAVGVAVLCHLAAAAVWLTVGLPIAIWVATTALTIWYMRRK